ncbi:MAG: S53 family peptidase [Candidatus Saccharimonadales bacterium]
MAKTKNVKRKKVSGRASKKSGGKSLLLYIILIFIPAAVLGMVVYSHYHKKADDLSSFQATPFYKVKPLAKPSIVPGGTTPAKLRLAYGLTGTGGTGTIAIVDAYDDPTAEADLGTFSSQYALSACTTGNGCFEKHKMSSDVPTSGDWAIEVALDTQWAHAVAPGAKILLVEANSAGGNDLLDAINYARARSDVVAISMSWGGDEFGSEASYESSFTSSFGASFFASSGDAGHGLSWPAVSTNVISVGGTRLTFDSRLTKLSSETAWSGSGGGTSRYISEPGWQTSFRVPNALNKRAVPDVSYDADPNSGFPVFDSTPYGGHYGWFMVGGTSAGAPQWAAIKAINHSLNASRLYSDAAQPRQKFLRDITSGSNGRCGYYCSARTGYDYVTGLGSPITTSF